MNIVKVLAVCIGLSGATAIPALAQHGGGFSGHAGGFSGHGGYSGGHYSGGHYAGHGAYGGGYHGGWGGHWHGGWGGGWYGGVYVNPWWYADAYPYYAYPDVAIAPAAPVAQVYAAPNSAPVASQGTWYYCQNPAGYYPYIKNCGGGWQQVPAQPQGTQ